LAKPLGCGSLSHAGALVGLLVLACRVPKRDLGFDLLQGHMFAKPMAPRKFERAMLARRYAAVA